MTPAYGLLYVNQKVAEVFFCNNVVTCALNNKMLLVRYHVSRTITAHAINVRIGPKPC